MPPRILTFNWHESYIHLLARTGYDFDVVERKKAGILGWIQAIRPVPANCRLVSASVATKELENGIYDSIIAHNLDDLIFVRDSDTPKVLLFHNKLTTEIALSKNPVDKTAYLGRVADLFVGIRNLRLVFISEAKKLDWGFEGEIIPPGIDPEDYGGYSGEEARVLRVGNGLLERDVMLGYSLQERVVAGLPSTILGLNAHIPEALVPRDWEAYRGFLRRHRVFLNTTMEPYEDGYNLAMLEAMATGMPVVSTANRSSPIEDGVNGFLAAEESELRDRLEALLKDRSLAVSIGRRAKQTVIDRFPIQRFIDRWAAVLKGGPAVRLPAQGQGTLGPGRGTGAGIMAPGEYYTKERSELAALIPEDAERILDVGCGGGHLGRILKERSGRREIWGVEIHEEAFREAQRWLDRVFQGDASEWEPPAEKGTFDVIVLADVLEHLLDPKGVLERFLPWLKPTGSVVMSIPNVRFWGLVKHLVDGHWTYQEEGLLDRGHVRFFTWREILRLLDFCGLECDEVRWNLDRRCPDVPDEREIDLTLGRITIHGLAPEELREFFVFQFLLRGVLSKERMLAEARRMEASGSEAEAFDLYARVAARDVGEPHVVRKLVEIGRTAEERRRASGLVEACLEVHPANVELLIASARLLAEDRRVPEARKRLERVLLFVPDHAEARARLEGFGAF
jgi:glycosyltransferase involved in cell wall biosynthesis/SAM-dependent methyltransferase